MTMLFATVLLTASGAGAAYAQDQMAGDKKPADKMDTDKMDGKMSKGTAKKAKMPKKGGMKDCMKDGDKMSKDGMSSHR